MVDLKEIENSLNMLTPGPYEARARTTDSNFNVCSLNKYLVTPEQKLVIDKVKLADAQFFIKAPEYVRQLIDRIRALETCVNGVISRVRVELDDSSKNPSNPHLFSWIVEQLKICIK